jgi:predicted DNA-binding protein (MmcQ/YjbR family)
VKVEKISGIGEYEREGEKYLINGKAFLVEHKNTVEVRCDRELAEKLIGEYESVMESRYFGRGGIEIVMSGQLSDDEVEDLVRLSYNLTKS